MSWRHIEGAGQIVLKRPPVKAVLLVLCHHADAFTGRCWPGLARIQTFTGLARRTVQNALVELEKLELVSIERGTGTKSSTYVLKIPGVEPVDQGGAPHDERGAPHDKGGAPAAPKQSENRKEKGARVQPQPLPDGWWPSEQQLAAALKRYTTADIAKETRLFVLNARKKGEVYVDYIAAWLAWLEHGEAFARRDQQRESANGARPARGGDALRQAAARSRGADLRPARKLRPDL